MKGRLEHEIKSNNNLKKKLKNMPPYLEDFYYTMQDKEYRTVESYTNHVLRYLKWLSNQFDLDITNPYLLDGRQETHAGAYMNYLKTGTGKEAQMSRSYRSVAWTALNHFYEFCVRKKYVEYNPMLSQKRENPARDRSSKEALTKEEVEEIFRRISEVKDEKIRARDFLLFSLMLDTAARITGILEINLDDINFKKRSVRIIGKGNIQTDHFLSDYTMNYLQRWLEIRAGCMRRESEALFLSEKGNRLSYESARSRFKIYGSGLNKEISPHTTRRTIATLLYEETHDIELVKDKLVHASASTTSRYIQKNNEHIVRANKIGQNLLAKSFVKN